MAKVQANAEPVIKIGPWGRDLDTDNWSFQIPKDGDIKAITIATGAVLDSLVFTIQDASGAIHTLKYGGAGGTGAPQLDFADNEYLISIAGAYGSWKGADYVTSLTFITNLGTYGPYGYDYDKEYGATGVVKFSFPVLKNGKVAGFYGYADTYIDRIGFYTKPVQASGVIGVGPWGRETSSRNGTIEISTGSNIKEIIVGHGGVIDSLTFTVQDANGQSTIFKLGGKGGVPSEIEFTADEYLTSIAGTCGIWKSAVYVRSLTFITNLGTYGPYGQEGTEKFSSLPTEDAEIAGFFVYSDNYIQNIGFYVRPKSSTDT